MLIDDLYLFLKKKYIWENTTKARQCTQEHQKYKVNNKVGTTEMYGKEKSNMNTMTIADKKKKSQNIPSLCPRKVSNSVASCTY